MRGAKRKQYDSAIVDRVAALYASGLTQHEIARESIMSTEEARAVHNAQERLVDEALTEVESLRGREIESMTAGQIATLRWAAVTLSIEVKRLRAVVRWIERALRGGQ